MNEVQGTTIRQHRCPQETLRQWLSQAADFDTLARAYSRQRKHALATLMREHAADRRRYAKRLETSLKTRGGTA